MTEYDCKLTWTKKILSLSFQADLPRADVESEYRWCCKVKHIENAFFWNDGRKLGQKCRKWNLYYWFYAWRRTQKLKKSHKKWKLFSQISSMSNSHRIFSIYRCRHTQKHILGRTPIGSIRVSEVAKNKYGHSNNRCFYLGRLTML